MPKFFVVSTPIGNLDDISARALETLKRVDFILCEDTRRTQKLLNHYNITTKTTSYHQHSKVAKINYILRLSKNKDLALVCDAGTPGISDPGNKLIEKIIETGEDIEIIPIPGASALTALASVSGFPMDRFLFLGFIPQKKKRKKFFEKILKSEYPVIIYESCYRILKTLNQLKELSPNVEIVVGRELTKKFETIYRGKIDKVIERIEKDKVKGEFVIIIRGLSPKK